MNDIQWVDDAGITDIFQAAHMVLKDEPLQIVITIMDLEGQLKTARAAQQQLQDELTAVTVERDELQTACKAFEATEAFLIDAAKKVQAERDAARAEVARLLEALEFIYPFTSPYGNENIITARKALDEIREAINLALTPTE